ncbi:hypothetical protein ACSDQ9_09035 [Aestuariimicrobium soli]|uniref:hypothetical protein n=1 Tax=Aestuariimicrobium soli TaxID=2035834 RepID=UPI003EC098F1
MTPLRDSPWGGAGRHGRGGAALFSPTLGWLTVGIVVWCAAMLHQRTCETTVAGQPVNAMLRLCYSDLPITYQNQLASGHSPWFTGDGGAAIDQPPLTGALMALLRSLVAVTHPVREGLTAQQALDAGNDFLVLASVVFGVCFLVLLRTQLATSRLLGRPTRVGMEGRGQGWTLAALCLTGFTAGMVSWELLGAAAMMIALWAWHARRWWLCGIAAGAAVGASGFLLPLVLVLATLAVASPGRGTRPADSGRAHPRHGPALAAGVAAAIVVLVNLPVALLWPAGWRRWIMAQLVPDLGLGAIWQQLLGENNPASTLVARVLVLVTALLVVAVLLAVVLGVVEARPEQLMLVVLGITVVLAPTYAPQQALLLVPLAALCRPQGWVAVLAAAEALYWGAVWAYLNGSLRFGPRGGETPYALTIIVRVTVVLITVLSVALECWRSRRPRGVTT